MFFKRKCKHPFDLLVVYEDATTKKEDEDFNYIDYHLYCQGCRNRLTLSYVKMIGGVSEFLKRKPKEEQCL